MKRLHHHIRSPLLAPQIPFELLQRLLKQHLKPHKQSKLPTYLRSDRTVIVEGQLEGGVAVEEGEQVGEGDLLVGLHVEQVVQGVQGLRVGLRLFWVDVGEQAVGGGGRRV
jgi:hypothetical protein